MAGRATAQSQPVCALGVTADADGIVVAAVQGDGASLTLGPGVQRGWTAAERATLATGGPGAVETVETAAATLIARLRPALPEAPALAGIEAARALPCGSLPDAGVLAEVTDLSVLWDFRSADLEMGGAGGPLAPVFWHALARGRGWDAPVAVVRLGRVARLACVDPRDADPRADGVLCALDAGPGPAFCTVPAAQPRRGRQASPKRALLDAALAAPFFARMPPRRLGTADLADLPAALSALPPAQAATTLRALVAEGLAAALPLLPVPPVRLILTGPGAAESGLVTRLRKRLPLPVETDAELCLDPALLGAQAVAFLALRVARGLPTTFPGTTGVAAPLGGAQIARPQAAAPAAP